MGHDPQRVIDDIFDACSIPGGFCTIYLRNETQYTFRIKLHSNIIHEIGHYQRKTLGIKPYNLPQFKDRLRDLITNHKLFDYVEWMNMSIGKHFTIIRWIDLENDR